jgi:WD40 repeat protein
MQQANSVILATAGYDHKINFWEPPSGVCSRTLRYSDSQVNCLRITPDKQVRCQFLQQQEQHDLTQVLNSLRFDLLWFKFCGECCGM